MEFDEECADVIVIGRFPFYEGAALEDVALAVETEEEYREDEEQQQQYVRKRPKRKSKPINRFEKDFEEDTGETNGQNEKTRRRRRKRKAKTGYNEEEGEEEQEEEEQEEGEEVRSFSSSSHRNTQEHSDQDVDFTLYPSDMSACFPPLRLQDGHNGFFSLVEPATPQQMIPHLVNTPYTPYIYSWMSPYVLPKCRQFAHVYVAWEINKDKRIAKRKAHHERVRKRREQQRQQQKEKQIQQERQQESDEQQQQLQQRHKQPHTHAQPQECSNQHCSPLPADTATRTLNTATAITPK
eukprot:m.72546 g.72546  ORF g.72546 m.72546 type:complete len:296 (+) comp11744_c0_seq2:1604-2491(+)